MGMGFRGMVAMGFRGGRTWCRRRQDIMQPRYWGPPCTATLFPASLNGSRATTSRGNAMPHTGRAATTSWGSRRRRARPLAMTSRGRRAAGYGSRCGKMKTRLGETKRRSSPSVSQAWEAMSGREQR
nr:unnamed protein product [Digitaria exilis]